MLTARPLPLRRKSAARDPAGARNEGQRPVLFSKYYQSELNDLRDLGQTYGRANPSIAGLLGERGATPTSSACSRAFGGFLTAACASALDDAVPEIVHLLSDLVVPHFLRTIPAALDRRADPESGPCVAAMSCRAVPPLASIALGKRRGLFRTTATSSWCR